MKAPAPGGNRGRAETSSQQQKCTAPAFENLSFLVYALRLGLPPVIDSTRPFRALLEIVAAATARAVSPAMRSATRGGEHQRRPAV